MLTIVAGYSALMPPELFRGSCEVSEIVKQEPLYHQSDDLPTELSRQFVFNQVTTLDFKFLRIASSSYANLAANACNLICL